MELGWWRKEKVGKPAQGDTQAIEFPNLHDEGAPAPAEGDDEVGIPLLVEDNSDDDDDDAGGGARTGDDDLWGLEDDAPILPVHGGPPAHVDGDAVQGVGGALGGAGNGTNGAVEGAPVGGVHGAGGYGSPIEEWDGDPAGAGGLGDGAAAGAAPRRSNRENRGVPPLRFIEMYLAAAAEEEAKQSPKTAKEALQGPHRAKWQKAMKSEMESLRENGVYTLVDRPKFVKEKWVLRVKTNAAREVEKYKARVVAKGYSQIEGVYYDQTFNPNVRFEIIRQLVAVGASKELELHQMDVTTAFLYAPLEEEVYMEQPGGTIKQGDENKVMLLLKCLYGLKQSPRQWDKYIDAILKGMGFIRLNSDFGIYMKGKGERRQSSSLYMSTTCSLWQNS